MFLQPIMFPPTLSSQYTVSLNLWTQSSRWHEHCTFITFVWSDSGLTDFVLTLIRDGRGSIDIILHQERCEVRTLFITLNPLSALSDSLALTVWVTLTSILSNIFWAIHLPSTLASSAVVMMMVEGSCGQQSKGEVRVGEYSDLRIIYIDLSAARYRITRREWFMVMLAAIITPSMLSTILVLTQKFPRLGLCSALRLSHHDISVVAHKR